LTIKTVEISSLHHIITLFSDLRNAIRATKIVMMFTIADNNSGGICATSIPHYFAIFYKSVAFFFKRSIELAHQAS